MSTLVKIIVTSILSLSLISCFNLGIKGNGEVVTKDRNIKGSFDQIEVSRGLEVYLTQHEIENIKVQADENLHPIITTTIIGKMLNISTTENIGSAAAKKVMVSVKNISKLTVTSGSVMYGTNLISEPNLDLVTSSGAYMDLDLNTNHLSTKVSSGGDIKLSGATNVLQAIASSGGNLHAQQLRAVTAHATATTGAHIEVNVSQEILMDTSTGGNITYLGNPEKIRTSEDISSKKQ